MSAPAPIDPFLSELRHAQLAGQRVLAAQRRPSTASDHRGRIELHPHGVQRPVPGSGLGSAAGAVRQQAD